MAFFNNLKNTAGSLGKGSMNVVNTGATDAKDASEIAEIKRELDSIENDIMSGYTQIGTKYVDYVKKTSEMPGIDVSDVLKMLDPKFERRDELQAKMIEIEKRRKDRTLLQEKSAVEAQVQAEIEKLDKALAMELIGQAEYDTKVAQLKKRVDNFEAIKKVEQKCQMGIITAAERDKEIEALLM